MTTAETYCRICEAACGLLADLDDRGKLIKLRPDRNHPVSRGFVCAKGTRFGEVASHPSRIVTPHRRTAPGTLTPTSWSEATRSIAAHLRSIIDRHGPHGVALYLGNPTIYNTGATLAASMFARRIGTRNVYSSGSQDCNNKFAGAELVHGSPLIHPIPDFEHTQLAILFGTNPAVSQSSFVHLEGGTRTFDRLVERGAQIIWIDPRRTESARRWGRHVPIRTGSDVWLLLALLNILGNARDRAHDSRAEGLQALLEAARSVSLARAAEHTGIPETEIRALAVAIGESPATTFHMSVGVNHGSFGTLCYVALQALAYVTGNFDRRGGLLFAPTALGMAKLFRALGLGHRKQRSRVGGFESVLDTLPGAILADEILEAGKEQIRALIVVAGDPLRSIPGEARLREAFDALELRVSVDLFENETGRLADWFLPATSWLERADVAVMTGILQQAPLLPTTAAVVSPSADARHEARILLDLLAAVDGSLAARLMARSCDLPWQRRFSRLGRGIRVPMPQPGRFLEGDRVVRFFGSEIAAEVERLLRGSAAVEDGPRPFTLIGRRRRLGHNTWLHGGERDGEAETVAWMAATDLAALGIPSGGTVRIESLSGGLEIVAAPKDGVAPRTIVVPHGLPTINVNALIPSGPGSVERVSGQHQMTGISVSVLSIAKA
jgi:formate dehydrogenase